MKRGGEVRRGQKRDKSRWRWEEELKNGRTEEEEKWE